MGNECKVTISRVNSSLSPNNRVRIELKVGKECHIVYLSLEEYAKAITGIARVPGEYELFVIGKEKENGSTI